MKGERIRQINNIVITFSDGIYYAWSPNGNIIYKDTNYSTVERCCRSNNMFLNRRSMSKKSFLRQVEEANRIESENANKIRSDLIRLNNTGRKLLFHGSNGGIIGDIRCNANNTACDFGYGFYTGEMLEQAENRIANRPNGVMYAYELKPGNYSVYSFDNDIVWALFVGYNRKSAGIDFSQYKKLLNIINFINGHDIIIGKIADDKIASVYNEFMLGNITDACLVECLKLVKYGNQTVFKNDTITKHFLTLVHSYKMTKQMRSVSIEWNKNMKTNMEDNIEEIKRQFRRKGKFIDERLEELK